MEVPPIIKKFKRKPKGQVMLCNRAACLSKIHFSLHTLFLPLPPPPVPTYIVEPSQSSEDSGPCVEMVASMENSRVAFMETAKLF